jgi:hypothetical protein
VHDLVDQFERMLGAFAEADEGDVRPFPRRDCSDVLHLDLVSSQTNEHERAKIHDV